MYGQTKAVAKNTAGRKTVSAKSSNQEVKPIKYEDKSEGQPELAAIFKELRAMLLQQVKGNLTAQGDTGGQVHLYSIKPVEMIGYGQIHLFYKKIFIEKQPFKYKSGFHL